MTVDWTVCFRPGRSSANEAPSVSPGPSVGPDGRRCSRRLAALAFLGCLGTPLAAAPSDPVPTEIHVQVRLTDAAGVPLNESKDVTIRLWDAPVGGTELLSVSGTYAVTNGFMSETVGPVDSSLLDAAPSGLFVGITVLPDAEMAPRLQVKSVPFATRAETARNAENVAGADITPNSVTVNGQPAVDSNGAWIGSFPPGHITGADVASDTLTGSNIADGSIGADDVQDESLTGGDVQDGSLSGDDLADGTITGSKIADESLLTDDIQDGSLTGDDIQDGSLNGVDIANGTITGTNIGNGTVTGDDIMDGSLTGSDIANESITGSDIDNGTVTGADIQNSSITSTDIQNGSIQGDDLDTPFSLSGAAEGHPTFAPLLNLRQTGSTDLNLNLESTSASVGVSLGFRPQAGNGNEWQFKAESQNSGADFSLYRWVNQSLSTVLTVDHPTAFVGISDTTPSERLDVNGNVRCTALIEVSDARLKTDIRPLEEANEVLSALRGVSYSWNREELPEADGRRRVGLLAQDVQGVLPEAVREDGNGTLGVEYSQLVPVLVEALKEQREELSRLRADNEDLRRELSTLGGLVEVLVSGGRDQ